MMLQPSHIPNYILIFGVILNLLLILALAAFLVVIETLILFLYFRKLWTCLIVAIATTTVVWFVVAPNGDFNLYIYGVVCALMIMLSLLIYFAIWLGEPKKAKS